MQKDTIYKRVEPHLETLRQNSISGIATGDYLCPICCRSFDAKEIFTEQITIEHAPQDALGGSPVALTCKNCNSTLGAEIDSQLVHYIEHVEFKDQAAGSHTAGRVDTGYGTIQGTIECEADKTVLKISDRNNNQKLKNVFGKLFSKGDSFTFNGKKKKFNENFVNAALLKNAYIILFARIGYPILFNKHYDILRKYIQNPDSWFLPKPLCRLFPLLPIDDGIYLCQNDRFKGFAVIYSLTNMMTHRALVLIPAISSTFPKAAFFLRPMNVGSTLRLQRLPDSVDYLTDVSSMQKLLSWAKSKDINISSVVN